MELDARIVEKLGNKEVGGYDAIVVGSGYGGSVAAYRMSMEGLKVCLIEKGKRWDAGDFPTNSWKILSTVRMEKRNSGLDIGPRNALFQLHEQNDSIAVVACGLGGGSLINAGVMLPTPVRARRNPKWPKEWERDWDICESSAAEMLGAQTVPVEFPIAKVMKGVVAGIGENLESSLKLSVKFGLEEPSLNTLKPRQIGSCLACGNCLSGCPYNAKNSTDKNYIQSAIQAGCVVKTECQIQYVVENPNEKWHWVRKSSRRRWLVFFNETDYIASDFVILSAGVLGTSEILFKSQMIGLRLSEALGSGLSCNGNTVSYVAGTLAPLNGYGLNKKHFSMTPFQERPGPSITSSYTSSLGFTIQSAVLPTAYPWLLFKGIVTYGWPSGHWFLHGIIDKLKYSMGLKSTQAVVLNAMGYDDCDGKIVMDKDTQRICFTPPQDPLLPRKVEEFQKITKKLGGTLFMSKYRSTSVHLLGGCIASKNSTDGVCNHKGQVFDPQAPDTVHPGLYVCDASLIPCSVGINPSLTIAAAAEYISRHLVQDALEFKSKREKESSTESQDSCLFSPKSSDIDQNSTLIIKEIMRGYVGGMPCTVHLIMKMNSQNYEVYGKENWALLRGRVGGYMIFKDAEKDKLQIIDGEVDLCAVDYRTPYTQYMHYRLLLGTFSGSRYLLVGRKIMNPYLFALFAWKETTTLHVMFRELTEKSSREAPLNLKGELRISFTELLKSIMNLQGSNRATFIYLFSKSLARTYILQKPRGTLKFLIPLDTCHKPYPGSIIHQLKTEDGCVVSCRQWKSSQDQLGSERKKMQNPVLLLNGYSTESYYLPTESNDLVRTLLEERHDVWLMQSRLHPAHPSNNFTIDDIAKYDIPAAMTKILQVHGPSTKIHVVAHCVGGLTIHIALLGGHISATHIASLSCTNSSMFFKLTSFSRVKMWLPLVPLSMAILGKDKILPLLEKSEVSSQHTLIKWIARYLPRYERCNLDECEIFSGIFGNTFWHENVSPTMHHWLNKQSSTKLPMAAFPHLRMICNKGFIVDSHGNGSYLIHPERMALSTLYISGERSLLVTPETSFLANKYMMLHQPGFRHGRVVVDGFGHSDLLIGEKSREKVFPHILSHISSTEQEGNRQMTHKNRNFMDWEDDLHEEFGGFGSWFSPSVVVFLLLSFLLFLVSLMM